jgi:hypothetical protein
MKILISLRLRFAIFSFASVINGVWRDSLLDTPASEVRALLTELRSEPAEEVPIAAKGPDS